jgi:protein SCO1/2
VSRNLLLSLSGLLVGLLIIAGVAFLRPYQMHGAVIDPPQPAPDFTLGDFKLASQQGKVTVLFFGYTHCADVCPATLDQMRQVLKNLGDNAGQVQMAFVTIDPQRDTHQVLKSYTAGFDSRILGITGEEADLKKVWQAYGVTVIKDPRGEVDDAVFEHSARIYVIDRKGNLRETLPTDSFVNDLLADINFLAKN